MSVKRSIRDRISSVYFGWWSVLAGSVISLWGGAFYGAGMSAFFKPLSADLGIGRGTASVATGIGRALNGPQSVVVGPLTDRFGPKWIILAGVFMMGVGLMLMRFIHSVWAYYLVWGLLFGVGANSAMALAMDKMITDWFIRKRGRAMSIRGTAGGLAGVVIVPLIAWLTTTKGWRDTCFIGGVVMLVVCLPIAYFLIKQRRPERYGWRPDGESPQTAQNTEKEANVGAIPAESGEPAFTLRQAIKTPAFWFLIMAVSGLDLIGPALTVHGIPLLTDAGIAPVKAAGMVAVVSFFSILGAFGIGFFADRVRKNHLRFLITGALLSISAGTGVFLLKQNTVTIYVWFVLHGLGTGAFGNLIVLTRSHYFGRQNFGAIHGTSMVLTPPFAPLAPIFAGWIYDRYQSYLPAFALFAALVAAIALLSPLARPPLPRAPAPG